MFRFRIERKRKAEWLEMAEGALRRKEGEEAVRFTGLVLTVDPTHVGALEVQAKAEWLLRRYTDVIRTTARLIQLNPYEPGYYSLRGAALHTIGRYKEAIDSCYRSIEIGSGAGAEASAMILEDAERSLVQSLLQTDASFRDAYWSDPVAACLSKGITAPNVAAAATAMVSAIRPS